MSLKTWLVILVLASGLKQASADLTELDEDLVNLIEDVVSETDPGLAVGVVVDGTIAFEHYRGLANLDIPSEIGPSSRFNIASNAKQFTALMALALADEGKIDLAKDFRVYLPGIMEGVEETISVAQLITHTSGIRDIYDLWALTGVTWYERPFRNRDAITLLNQQVSLNFEPGKEFLYSNSNYNLLAELISKVVGEPFHSYASTFFSARGMTDTIVRRRYGEVVPGLARAYGNWGGWMEQPALANLNGDGFLFTTLRDQLAWERQVWGNEITLPHQTIQSSQRPLLKPESPGFHYGFGLEFGTYRGADTVYHQGSTGGYQAYTLRFIEAETSVVVVSNSSQVDVVGLSRRLADRVLTDDLGAPEKFPSGPAQIGQMGPIDEFTGPYELDSGTFIRIVRRNGDLFREIEGRDPVKLMAEQGNVYRYEPPSELRIAFEWDEADSPTFTLYLEGQPPQYAVSVPPIPADPGYLQTFLGTYRNNETGTTIQLESVSGVELKMTKNGKPRKATLVGKDYVASGSYRIRIKTDDDPTKTELRVSNNRIRDVEFLRVE